MDDDQITLMMKKAKKLALASKFPNEADDFAQEIAIKQWELSEGPHEGFYVNLKWAWVDYLRSKYGDSRAKYRQTIDNINTVELDDYVVTKPIEVKPHINDKLKAHLYLKATPYQAMISASYLNGLSFAKIANILGVSASYISNIIRGINGKRRQK